MDRNRIASIIIIIIMGDTQDLRACALTFPYPYVFLSVDNNLFLFVCSGTHGSKQTRV